MATTINDILQEIRLKAEAEREKGTDFERLMKLWFLTYPRYAELEKVWLWEEFPGRKDFGGKDRGIGITTRYGMPHEYNTKLRHRLTPLEALED